MGYILGGFMNLILKSSSFEKSDFIGLEVDLL